MGCAQNCLRSKKVTVGGDTGIIGNGILSRGPNVSHRIRGFPVRPKLRGQADQFSAVVGLDSCLRIFSLLLGGSERIGKAGSIAQALRPLPMVYTPLYLNNSMHTFHPQHTQYYTKNHTKQRLHTPTYEIEINNIPIILEFEILTTFRSILKIAIP